ncbi:MAG: hypothetical protein RLZZ261_363 [Bacteroidota bacterium]|jgi:uncharacterized membrane protein
MLSPLGIISQSRRDLSGQWGLAIGTTLAYGLIVGILGFIDSSFSGALTAIWIEQLTDLDVQAGFLQVFWTGAFSLGYAAFMLRIVRRSNPDFEQIFSGFQRWGRATWTLVVYFVRVLLWLLLLIIPGIVKMIAYSQIWYVLNDQPELTAGQALKRSEELMHGHKLDYLMFGLLLVLLVLASVLTLFIGLIWIAPWVAAAQARFYVEIREEWEFKNPSIPN